MNPQWQNQNSWDDPIDHCTYGWLGGVTVWVTVNFADPLTPPYLIDRDGRHWTWHDGLISDGNSVPKIARGIFPTDYCEPAPFLHDEAYRTRQLLSRASEAFPWTATDVTRQQADDLIYQGWIAAGGQLRRCQIAYGFLRAFGWVDWKGQ